MLWTPVFSTSDISHYGVKGMKWGVRKEYEPVGNRKKGKSDYSKHDHPSKEGTKRQEDYIKKQDGYEKVIETKNGTTVIKINGKTDYGSMRNFIRENKDISPAVYAPESEAMRKFRELPKINTNRNNAYERFAINKDGYNYERRSNCFECCMAYEMRKRGYDVQANEVAGGLATEVLHAFNIENSFLIASTSTSEAYNRVAGQCLSYGEGARGSINLYWATGGGHAINWEIKEGKFVLIDTQSDDVPAYDSFMACDPSTILVWRLDNAEVLPGITDFVEPYEAKHDAFYDVKWKKSMSKRIEEGKVAVANAIKSIGNDISKFISKGKAAINAFLKDPFDKSGERKAKKLAKKKAKESAKKKKKDKKSKKNSGVIEWEVR